MKSLDKMNKNLAPVDRYPVLLRVPLEPRGGTVSVSLRCGVAARTVPFVLKE